MKKNYTMAPDPNIGFNADMTFMDLLEVYKENNLPVHLDKSEFGSLDGKLVVVTGANRGLGNALIKVLAKYGASVIGTARKQSDGEALLQQIKDINPKGKHAYVLLDYADDVSVQKAAQDIAKLGKIDFLVNNGVYFSLNQDKEGHDQTMKTNVAGYVDFTKLVVPNIKKGGKIIFVSSSGGQLKFMEKAGSDYVRSINSVDDPAFKGQNVPQFKIAYKDPFLGLISSYCLSKALENRYVQLAAKEPFLTNKDIEISSVCPGACKNGSQTTENNPYQAEDGANSVAWNLFSSKDLNGQFFTYGLTLNYD